MVEEQTTERAHGGGGGRAGCCSGFWSLDSVFRKLRRRRQECKEMSKKGNETGMSSSSVFYIVAEVGKYLLPSVARPCLYAHTSQLLVPDRSNG